MAHQLAKVWPLEEGIKGCSATGHPVILSPGLFGYMEYEEAVQAEKDGLVQMAAGKTPESLKKPNYRTTTTKPKPRRGGRGQYVRSDMTAEKAEE